MHCMHFLLFGLLLICVPSVAHAQGDPEFWHDGTPNGFNPLINALEENGYEPLLRYRVTVDATIDGEHIVNSAVWQTMIRTWETPFASVEFETLTIGEAIPLTTSSGKTFFALKRKASTIEIPSASTLMFNLAIHCSDREYGESIKDAYLSIIGFQGECTVPNDILMTAVLKTINGETAASEVRSIDINSITVKQTDGYITNDVIRMFPQVSDLPKPFIRNGDGGKMGVIYRKDFTSNYSDSFPWTYSDD